MRRAAAGHRGRSAHPRAATGRSAAGDAAASFESTAPSFDADSRNREKAHTPTLKYPKLALARFPPLLCRPQSPKQIERCSAAAQEAYRPPRRLEPVMATANGVWPSLLVTPPAPHRRARALADTGAGADRLLSCREATLGRGQAAPLERDATHPLAQPHAGAAQASTGGRGDHGPAGAVPRAHGRQDPHAPQLLPEEPSSFRLHHNGRLGLPRGSGAVESAIRRVINLRIKGASIYWLPESVDAILLLRSFYKSGRWNCLQRMAMTPVGVSA